MPFTTTFSRKPNRLPNSRPNSARTQIIETLNEPNPIFGHLAADRSRTFAQLRPAPIKPHQWRPPGNNEKPSRLCAAVSNRFPQCAQSCRSRNHLIYSIPYPTLDPRAPTQLQPRSSKHRTNPVPFPDTSPPIAASSRRVSISARPGASGLVFQPPNARHYSIDGSRLTADD
jgi:hypothetical protein